MRRSLPLTFAGKGYVCGSVHSHLLEEAGFPACIEDCCNAVRWLRAHAGQYDIDSTRLGAFGNSAGAHLVSMLGLTSGLEELGAMALTRIILVAGSGVACCATLTDFLDCNPRIHDEREITERIEQVTSRFFWGYDKAVGRAFIAQGSTMNHVKAGVPFLVIHGTADQVAPVFRDDSFVDAMRKSQAEVSYLRVADVGHGIFHQAADETLLAVELFFAETLRLKSKRHHIAARH